MHETETTQPKSDDAPEREPKKPATRVEHLRSGSVCGTPITWLVPNTETEDD